MRGPRNGVIGDPEELFADLLGDAQQGDPRAFEQIVTWLSGPLLGFVTARGADSDDGASDGDGDGPGNAAEAGRPD